jgi:hypothetical protein
VRFVIAERVLGPAYWPTKINPPPDPALYPFLTSKFKKVMLMLLLLKVSVWGYPAGMPTGVTGPGPRRFFQRGNELLNWVRKLMFLG